MTLLRLIIFLPFAATLTFGQSGHQSKPPRVREQPEAMVRNFYKEVVARHPVSIPSDAKMKVFTPYLSKALLHRIKLALACSDDWDRQYPDRNLKPPFAWLEMGLFTGGNEKHSPRTFRVEKTQPGKNGSSRVYVKFTWGRPPNEWIWRTAAIVVQEDDRFVIDDIIFLRDEESGEDEYRLSETLAAGCDGPRWVGYGNQRNDLEQQRQVAQADRCDYTGDLVRSWLDLPAVMSAQGFSFLEKDIYRGGDAIAGGVAVGLSPEELRDPARLDRILSLIRVSFSRPDYIQCNGCRNPRVTWLLLYFLEHEVGAEAAKRNVIETEEYISSQTKQKVPWRSVSP